MKNKLFIILFIIVGYLIYYLVIERRFNSDLLMKEQSSIIKLSSLTNFDWDTAELSTSNEDFEKITFYKNGIDVYREIIKLNFDDGYESQYLFESNNRKDVASNYKCFYTSSIRLKKIEKISEGKVTFYIYEPIGCEPIN
ncbi:MULTISPECIES: hypothetical protein [unclassified Acinetobacter]|uniref:hypothetical protein n=1 Tax=unclassified Acinetobacter TaxID=196816 RepID=UPI002934AD32|nr:MULTISPECIES: hypothetical protein [unclassified Acinetobacter]WOE32910.1 hypothetical protein QSG84_07055 [Acinetobacter sp. SAAs470]WOE38387.1 hypothetical protein QSG86_16110 [Acinetobacter sp. SAAs474]